MFTGLVDDVGTIEAIRQTGAGLELRVSCRYDDLQVGESVSVNGACLTVIECQDGYLTVAAMTTTVEVTDIEAWRTGTKVNLERAVRPTDRMGGHFVQGHVDGVARVVRAETVQDTLLLELALPTGLADLMVERGSVALDGVSLTISALPGADMIQVSIIDHTRRHTTLGAVKPGDSMHVEADIIAKHVRRLLSARDA
jgi:riboflavin synthase